MHCEWRVALEHCDTLWAESPLRKVSQQYFCPAEYSTKTKPKTNPNPKLSLFFRLGLVLELVLGFGLGAVYMEGGWPS